MHNTLENADSWPRDDPPQVLAISDGQAWFWDGQQMRVANVAPSTSTGVWPDDGLRDSGTVQSAGGGHLLVRVADGLAVVPDNKRPRTIKGLAHWDNDTHLPARPQVSDIGNGDLAPDGRHWFTHDGGGFSVYDSTTGHEQDPTHDGFEDVTPYQWLSGDTIAALAHPADAPKGSLSILTCRVSTNACSLAVRDVGTADDVVVPSGPTTRDR